MVAEDLLPDPEICSVVGIARATLYNWKQKPEFQLAVAEYKEVFRKRILSEGIARVENRVKAQNSRHDLLEEVIRDRSIAYDDPAIPGGRTGLLVRQIKHVKVFEIRKSVQDALSAGDIAESDLSEDDFIATKQTRAVEEYSVDTGLLAELRKLEDITAIELGQRIEKKELSGSIEFVEQAAGTLNEKLLSAVVTSPAASVPGVADPA